MNHINRVIILFLFFIAAAGLTQSRRWSSPAEVNPYDAHAGDFLDLNLQELSVQAEKAMHDKQYEEAARRYLYLLQFDHTESRHIYNLACCYARLRKPELAVRYLRRALDAGFNAYNTLVTDPDLAFLRGYAEFDTLLVHARLMSQNSGDIIYVKAEKAIKCRVRLPDDYRPDKKYPLLIGLHGNGGNADDMITLYRDFSDRNIIFIAPEGPYPYPQNDNAGMNRYSWALQIKDEKVWAMADPLTIDLITAVVRQAKERYKVSEVHLLGFSQGASYAYMAGIKHPNLFRTILCFGGSLQEKFFACAGISQRDIEKATGLRVFIAHGVFDPAIHYQASVDAQNWLLARGFHVELVHFNGGHEIPANVLNRGLTWMWR